jgi:hypothetical protein
MQSNQQIAPSQSASENKLRITSGTITLLFGVFYLVIGFMTFFQNMIIGSFILAISIYWVVTGIRILTLSSQKSVSAMQQAAVTVIAYSGVLLIAGLAIPGYRLSAVILPLIVAIVLAILARKAGAR